MPARRQPAAPTPVAATVLVWGTLALYVLAALAAAAAALGASADLEPAHDPDFTTAKCLLGAALAGHAVSLGYIAIRITRRRNRRHSRRQFGSAP